LVSLSLVRRSARYEANYPGSIIDRAWSVRRAILPTATDAISRNRKFVDSPLEGSGFELPVPRCAVITNSTALVAPPDPAVSGGSLDGRLTNPERLVRWPLLD
jgi:hypothetical protein